MHSAATSCDCTGWQWWRGDHCKGANKSGTSAAKSFKSWYEHTLLLCISKCMTAVFDIPRFSTTHSCAERKCSTDVAS